MKQVWKYGVFLGILVMVVLTACQKESLNPEAAMSRQAQIEALVAADAEELFFDMGIDDETEAQMYDGYTSFGMPAPLNFVEMKPRVPRRFFGRIIKRPIHRIVEQNPIHADTILADITGQMNGKFYSLEIQRGSNGERPGKIFFKKEMSHIVKRKAIFVRREKNPDADRKWKVHAISLGEGKSNPNSTITLQEVSITDSNGTTLIYNDPLNTMIRKDEIPIFAPGQKITIRVKLKNTAANKIEDERGATETLLLHYGRTRRHHGRKRFQLVNKDLAAGVNTYEGTWRIGSRRFFRIHHVIIDALDNGTIYNADKVMYPYNSTTWDAFYRVKGVD